MGSGTESMEELEERVRQGFEHWAPVSSEIEIAWSLGQKLKEHHPPSYTDDLKTALKTVDILQYIRFHPRPGIPRISSPRPGLYGGYLHDTGKVDTPVGILDKAYTPGSVYTLEDHKEIKKHPWRGYEICLEHGLLMTAWMALLHQTFDLRDPYPRESERPPYPPEFASEKTRILLRFNTRMVSLADQYIAGHRPNIPRTSAEIKLEMLAKNPDQKELILELYKNHVFV